MTPEERGEEVIAAYRETFAKAQRNWEDGKQNQYLYSPTKPYINWDEDWDGLLVARVHKIAAAGYWISQVYRKQKITLRIVNQRTKQQFANDMFLLFGDSFRGLAFDPAAIWWGVGSKYRG